MKNGKYSIANDPEVASVQGHAWKIVRAYEQTGMLFTTRSCFRKAELLPNTPRRLLKLEFNKEARRQNDALKELWDRNISVAELSTRWQVIRSGIHNAEFLDA
jgi:hypothetical protein